MAEKIPTLKKTKNSEKTNNTINDRFLKDYERIYFCILKILLKKFIFLF
jgi:hypothetical protein